MPISTSAAIYLIEDKIMANRLLIYIIAFVLGVGVVSCGCSSEEAPQEEAQEDLNRYLICLDSMPDDGCIKLRIGSHVGSLGREFNDKNDVHLSVATAIGIEPITDMASAWHTSRPMVKIETCRDFYVDRLTHSLPFLVPEAADLLHDIGRSFNDTLAARGGGSYRIKVTSVLRTPASVAKLRRRNVNASEASAHQYGTTFDISYSKFICDSITVSRTQEDLKNLLGEILISMRDSARCYVKYERKQACFHITARGS